MVDFLADEVRGANGNRVGRNCMGLHHSSVFVPWSSSFHLRFIFLS